MIVEKEKKYPVVLSNMISIINDKNVAVPINTTLLEIPGYTSQITVDDFLTPLETPAAALDIISTKEAYNDQGVKIIGSLVIDPTIVKLGEEIRGVTGTYLGPIQLDTLEVKTPPTKLIYEFGELFDDTDLAITANYSNTATRDITPDTILPDTELTLEDIKVTASFAEGGVTKTIDIAITVNEIEVTAAASDLNSATGSSTITMNKIIAGLMGTDIIVEKNGEPLIQDTDYTLAGLDTASITITFLEAAAIIGVDILGIDITKTGYNINSNLGIAINNIIA